MKALTIWQPWASLIIEGAKPYEFRGWRAPRFIIGQRIVIHAGARPIRRDEVADLQTRLADPETAWTTCLHAEPAEAILQRAALQCGGKVDQSDLFNAGGADFERLPISAGIGTVIVGEPRNGEDIARDFGHSAVNDSDRDAQANWGWPMLQIERWDTPLPMKGAQGLWPWPEPGDAFL